MGGKKMTEQEIRDKFPNVTDDCVKETLRRFGSETTPVAQPTRPDAQETKGFANSGSGASKRIRQKSGPKMNKLESEFWEVLRNDSTVCDVRPHAKTYVLGNGVRYTPDFTGRVSQVETAWEVKGKHSWDDALVKIKMAPTIFPEIRWFMVWKDSEGQWQKQKVLP